MAQPPNALLIPQALFEEFKERRYLRGISDSTAKSYADAGKALTRLYGPTSLTAAP